MVKGEFQHLISCFSFDCSIYAPSIIALQKGSKKSKIKYKIRKKDF